MLVCIDVAYRDEEAIAACVGFRDWTDAEPSFERAIRVFGAPAPYKPGELYLRELPYVVSAIAALTTLPRLIVVDGYVWLGRDRPGLGAKLYEHLRQQIPVIGVAKRPYRGND